MATVDSNQSGAVPVPLQKATANASHDRVLPWLLGAALVGVVLQITLGGVVRVTGSGLGCPDWPLCHGTIVPVFRDYHVALEWSHRLTGSLLGITLVAAAARIWLARRAEGRFPWLGLNRNRRVDLSRLSGFALALIAVVGGIGGLVVLRDLSPSLRTFHLALAEGLALIILAGWTFSTKLRGVTASSSSARGASGDVRSRLTRLAWVAAAVVLVTLLTGSYAVWRGAGAVCASWPLCGGAVFPESTLATIHVTHRLLAGLGSVFAIWVGYKVFRSAGATSALRNAAVILVTLVVGQVLMGAANPWTDFDEWARALHLSLATLVWLAASFVALLLAREAPAARAEQAEPR